MKRILVLIIVSILTASQVIYAQDTDSAGKVIEEGKSWLVIRYVPWGMPLDNELLLFKVEEATQVDGIDCHRISISTVSNHTATPYFDDYGREVDGVVSYYTTPEESTTMQFMPIMNFNLKEGDEIGFDRWVKKVDYITDSMGVTRKRITFGSDEEPLYWIEGIGCNRLEAWMYPFEITTNGEQYHLIACYNQDGSTIFSNKEFGMRGTASAPSPAVTSQSPDESPIFDINGLETDNPQPGKIYIHNRKAVTFNN